MENLTLDTKKAIQEDDFIWVLLITQDNKVKKEFAAKFQNISNKKSQVAFEVKFKRKYRQYKDIFIFSQIYDVSVVYKEKIL